MSKSSTSQNKSISMKKCATACIQILMTGIYCSYRTLFVSLFTILENLNLRVHVCSKPNVLLREIYTVYSRCCTGIKQFLNTFAMKCSVRISASGFDNLHFQDLVYEIKLLCTST